jgi:enoyl-CoA hydratase
MGVSENSSDNHELIVENKDGICILRLNRPERRNALSDSLKIRLVEEVLAAESNDEIRVVIFTGTGDAAFCSGRDLKNAVENDNQGKRFSHPMNQVERNLFEVVYEMKKPTIAAINGTAVAGGFELALACDLRVTHANSLFGLPEAKIGMGANFGSVILPRLIGPTFALELLMTGEYIDAKEAYRLGILNRIVEPDQVMSVSLALAKVIADNAPISVRRVKAVALRGLDMSVSAALRQDPGMSPYLSEDRKEGIKARMEKRKPVWKNR